MNSTLSRVIKDSTVAAGPLQPAEIQRPPLPGLSPFAPKQVGELESGSDVTAARALGLGAQAPAHAAPGSTESPKDGKVDLEEVRKEAFQSGFAEGERTGNENAMRQMQGAIASFGQAAHELTSVKPRLRAEAERELVALSLAIARRIIHRELHVDPTTVLAIVRACLQEFDRVEIQCLTVSPEDLEAVAAYFRENPVPNLKLVADPSVSRGGAVFQTNQGELDARIETQLQEIEYGLADR